MLLPYTWSVTLVGLAGLTLCLALVIISRKTWSFARILGHLVGAAAVYVLSSWALVLIANTTAVPVIGIPLTAVTVYMIGNGGMLLFAKVIERCPNLRKRFTGPGSSKGFLYANPCYSIMIALGMAGCLNSGVELPMPVYWANTAIAIAIIVHLGARLIDSRNYGKEEDGEEKSTSDSPTKVYHDLTVQGIWWYLQFMTYVPLVIKFLMTLSGSFDELNLMVALPYVIGIVITAIICVVLMLVIQTGPLNYAKLHPANWGRHRVDATKA